MNRRHFFSLYALSFLRSLDLCSSISIAAVLMLVARQSHQDS